MLTFERRAALRLTEETERRLRAWIAGHVGCVVSADGRGGSGTFVQLPDGPVALVTARHVVIDCMLTGWLSVARLRVPSRTAVPLAAWIDPKNDAALLVLREGTLEGEAVQYAEWSEQRDPLAEGMPVVAVGVVGEWKKPDISTRTIPQTHVLSLCSIVVDPEDHLGRLACHVDETLATLPRSFGGMSGGPLLSTSCHLLGVNTDEMRRRPGSNEGTLFATPFANLERLLHRFSRPPDLSGNHIGQVREVTFRAIGVNHPDRWFGLTAVVEFWSPSDPGEGASRFGRVVALLFSGLPGVEAFSINTDLVFHDQEDDSDEERIRAVKSELAFLFEDAGFSLIRAISAPGP